MKTIIAGSRSITDKSYIDIAVEASGFEITVVVSGMAEGIDSLGEIWAADRNIPIKMFPADWKNLGPSAGPIRNMKMADYADAAIVIWDGFSRGSKSMIDIAKLKKLNLFVLKL